jgi:hypothetical protein
MFSAPCLPRGSAAMEACRVLHCFLQHVVEPG